MFIYKYAQTCSKFIIANFSNFWDHWVFSIKRDGPVCYMANIYLPGSWTVNISMQVSEQVTNDSARNKVFLNASINIRTTLQFQ